MLRRSAMIVSFGVIASAGAVAAVSVRPALGQPLIVENKAGVSGSIAAETVFNAEPDGYTLLASQPAPITTNKFLYKTLPIAIMSHVRMSSWCARTSPPKRCKN